ncbi:hypothetical protein SAMN06265360_10179 [Haloechinothrix alba]|uniref:SseB protein N-terminal domain-containing protein n=1 Tax=Haloechinothrix alba TaxID=664784 RepID=A0A238V0H3_9PSEU|nr:SAV_915 family protein [Haloechinothrix alba]SNR27507.1 hypothetical protein SAMN06265360_10179 [Haloechinothrix alba]
MAEGDGLRPFDRTTLVLFEDLSGRAVEELYVLTGADGALELRQTPQGEIVFVAFTSFTRLATSCGAGQPHARPSFAELERVVEAIRPTVLVGLDVWLPEGHRYPEPDPRAQEPLERIEEVPAGDGRVWIPSRPVRKGDRTVMAELHPDESGKPLLCVYTSLDALRQSCGPYQAAAAIEADSIEQVADESGARGVAINPVLAEEARHTGVVQDWSR